MSLLDLLVPALWLCGVAHVSLVAANVAVVRVLDYPTELARLSPVVRQIFVFHSIAISLVLLLFAAQDLAHARELAGATPHGRLVGGAIALFWAIRFGAQVLVYDRAVRRRHRAADTVFTATFAALAAIHGVAAVVAPAAA
jgi:hypothetical protein